MPHRSRVNLSLEQLYQIDRACDRFEAALAEGVVPSVDEYLNAVSGDARAALEHELRAILQDREADNRAVRVGGGLVLRMISPGGSVTERVFHEPTSLVVGRSPDAHLVSEDEDLDRLHCCITIDPPACRVLDLGSSTGTWVDGTRQHEAMRVAGKTIRVGGTEIRVVRPMDLELQRTESVSRDRSVRPATGADAAEVASTATFDRGSPSVSSPEPLTTIPGYDVVREIGRGGMGVVYEAVRKSTGRPTALKVIIPPRSTDEKALQLFLREASTLSQLQHKRIVRFHELGMSRGRMFLAMEYIPAMGWDKIIAQRREPGKVRILCAIVCQVLEALDYAHRLGLVHRDVKRSNVLVTRQGKKLRTKLADFGLAKNFQHAGLSEMTAEGETRGTLAYMPPEQLRDARYAKPSADIYATGVLLYHLLSDAFPYEPTRERDLVTRILEDEPVPLKSRCPELPGELCAIVHHALAKRPRQRFRSAGEMYQALLPFARHDDAATHPLRPAEAVSRWRGWFHRITRIPRHWLIRIGDRGRDLQP